MPMTLSRGAIAMPPSMAGNQLGVPTSAAQCAGPHVRPSDGQGDDDLEWDVDRFRVKGVPEMSKTMTELAFAAYNKIPPGMEPGLEAVSYYDPPNMTYPFGAYVCVVDIDVDTGVTEIRRFYRSMIAALGS